MRSFRVACKIGSVAALSLASWAAASPVAFATTGVGAAASTFADHGDALYSAEQTSPMTVGAIDASLPAAYLKDPLRLSSGAIDAWLENPNTILETYPLGGPAMVSYVRLLAGSDARTIAALVAVAKDATVTTIQIDAIGKGLARASQRGQVIAPDYVAYIQKLVAESGSVPLIDAFAKALAEPETSELAPGGSLTGGAASVSPGTLNGSGSIGPSGSVGGVSAVASSSGSFAIGGGSVGGTGGGNTVPVDVSPVR